METFADSRNKPPRWKTAATPMTAVFVLVCCVLLLTMPTSETASVYTRNGRHGNGNGNGAAAGASSAHVGGGPRGPSRNGRANGNGGVPASQPVYTIERPAECRNETIFADCFLCGKITEDIRVYRTCCQRNTEIISFCIRLLS